jgi:dTDP-4-dehydrorhamnose 3,5-epimerase
MIFHPTDVVGAFVVELQRHEDERGSFARAWCRREFAAAGIDTQYVQGNTVRTYRRGTVRGMHYQLPPHAEAKLVRCIRGAVWPVGVDLRPGSPSFGRWVGVKLTGENGKLLYLPEGCAHGYQVLQDDSEVFYLVSDYYAPDHERGFRFDDPAFGIDWPLPASLLSEKDQRWPPFDPGRSGIPGSNGDPALRVPHDGGDPTGDAPSGTIPLEEGSP